MHASADANTAAAATASNAQSAKNSPNLAHESVTTPGFVPGSAPLLPSCCLLRSHQFLFNHQMSASHLLLGLVFRAIVCSPYSSQDRKAAHLSRFFDTRLTRQQMYFAGELLTLTKRTKPVETETPVGTLSHGCSDSQSTRPLASR